MCVAIAACSRVGDSTTPQIAGIAARAAAVKYQTIFTFDGSDGASPESRLRFYAGTFYGTTKSGGAFGHGTVFSVTPAGKEHVVYSFRGGSTDGSEPEAGVEVLDGVLFGTTYSGGPDNFGTVYSVTLSGKEHVLHRFGKEPDGQNPTAALTVLGSVLYGTTSAGGLGGGTVFSITKTGSERIMHRFNYYRGKDGYVPFSGLTSYQGLLYGTTSGGGTCKGGTIFSMSTAGRENTLHNFWCKHLRDGSWPDANLTVSNGVFYGTTLEQGLYSKGIVFGLKPLHDESIIYAFQSDYDGFYPEGSLAIDKGVMYGTTYEGGSSGVGNIFSVKNGIETVIHSFGVPPDGQEPKAGLVEVNGTFYGTTTVGGGFNNDGTVYKITP